MSIFLQKLIIETPWLNHLRPKADDSRWSRISFDVNCSPHQAPSVKSVGITGQLTGSRADLMILDDIEVPGNSMTELMREKLLQLCTEAESILTPKDDSRIMYLGTPQTTRFNYLLQFMLDTPIRCRKIPTSKWQIWLSPLLILTTLLTPSSGAQTPQTLSKNYQLSDYLEIISTVQCDVGEWGPYTESICSIDPSGRGQTKQPHAFISQRNGFLYLHKMRAYRDGYSDKILDILRHCKQFKVTKLVIETNFMILLQNCLKNIQQTKQSIDVEEVRANVRKEDRIIDALEPVLNQHRLIVDRKVIDWDYNPTKTIPLNGVSFTCSSTK